MASVITNPVEALVLVGKENTELHQETARLYKEIDRYREALTEISTMQHGGASFVAKQTLGNRSWKT